MSLECMYQMVCFYCEQVMNELSGCPVLCLLCSGWGSWDEDQQL